MNKLLSYYGAYGLLITSGVIMISKINKNKSNYENAKMFFLLPGSMLLNIVLKIMIKEKRPSGTKNVNMLEKLIDDGTYGMPSGHAQIVGTQLGIVFFSKTNYLLKIATVTQMVATLCQRYIFKKHTAMQLSVGFMIGIFISTYFLYINKKK